MNQILLNREIVQEAKRLLFLLGKYSNHGIDTKIAALHLSEILTQILSTESNQNEHN